LTASGAVQWTLSLTGSSTAGAGNSTLNLMARVTDAKTGAVFAASQTLPLTVTASPQAVRAPLPLLGRESLQRGNPADRMAQ
jgi:hypothetical protein